MNNQNQINNQEAMKEIIALTSELTLDTAIPVLQALFRRAKSGSSKMEEQILLEAADTLSPGSHTISFSQADFGGSGITALRVSNLELEDFQCTDCVSSEFKASNLNAGSCLGMASNEVAGKLTQNENMALTRINASFQHPRQGKEKGLNQEFIYKYIIKS